MIVQPQLGCLVELSAFKTRNLPVLTHDTEANGEGGDAGLHTAP